MYMDFTKAFDKIDEVIKKFLKASTSNKEISEIVARIFLGEMAGFTAPSHKR